MTARYDLKTDHWSKMRMNAIKNSINTEQRGCVFSWEKHQKLAIQRELEAAIRGRRSLPQNDVGVVHSFQDILTVELDEYLPGSSYLRRRSDRNLQAFNEPTKNILQCRHPLLTDTQYTLMTSSINPQSNQTRSRVPVLQCRGKI